VTAQDLDFQGDTGGALSIDLDSESLTIAGGTGLDTVGSGNTVTVNIDSTVATLTGTQTLTNKTLTTPIISSISNTGTLTLPTSTDTLVGRATTDTLTNKTLTSPDVNTPDIDGGTIDGTVIGGATPAAGTFTTLTANTSLAGTLSTAAQPNITSLGTLTALTGGTGDLNWDSGTLFVDSSANSVGIGTSSPAYSLDVQSSATTGIVAMFSNEANQTSEEALIWIAGQNKTNYGVMLGAVPEADTPLVQDHAFIVKTNDSTGTDHIERFRISSDGKVGIGTTSPSAALNIVNPALAAQFRVSSTESDATTKYGAIVGSHYTNAEEPITGMLMTSSSSVTGGTVSIGGGISAANAVNNILFYTAANNTTLLGSERMRIDSSGNLLVGTTESPATLLTDGYQGFGISGGGYLVSTRFNNPSAYFKRENSDGHVVQFLRDASVVGSVTVTTSATTFNTSSDARLKDVTGKARGLEVINKLNPVAYNWKVDGKSDEGLIAQEVLDIVPNAVSGSEEDMYQMDYSKLVVHLVAGMKEQQAQIEALQSEINLLKGE
jgi:hypothetical protein